MEEEPVLPLEGEARVDARQDVPEPFLVVFVGGWFVVLVIFSHP